MARNAACRGIRCSRASRTPTCRTSPARGSCSRRARELYPQFATHNAHTVAAVCADGEERRARVRVPAPARHGRGSLRRGHAARGPRRARAACTRRWASTRTCCRTWCAGCSRTARTRRSSTASSTRTSRSRASSPIRCGPWTATRRPRIRASRCRSTSTSRSAAIRSACTSPTAPCCANSPTAWNTCRGAPWVARALHRGQGRSAAPSSRCAIPPTRPRSSATWWPRPRRRCDEAIAIAARAQPDWDAAGPEPACRRARARRRPVRAEHARARRHVRARGRQDGAGQHRRGARGRRLPALLRGARP